MPHIPQNPRMDSAEVRPIRGFFTMHDRCTAPIENGGGPAERQFAAAPRGGLHSVCRRRRTESETHVPFFRRRTTRRPAPSAATGRRSAETVRRCAPRAGASEACCRTGRGRAARRRASRSDGRKVRCKTPRRGSRTGAVRWRSCNRWGGGVGTCFPSCEFLDDAPVKTNADYCYSFGGRLWKTLKQTSTYSPRRNDVENHIPCHTARAAPQSGICAWLFRVNFPDFPPAKTTRDSGLCLQRYEKIGMLLIFSLRKRRS